MCAGEPKVPIKNFDKLLETLVKKNCSSCVSTDMREKQCRKLIVDKKFIEKCKKFDLFESRQDEFSMEVFNSNNENLKSD